MVCHSPVSLRCVSDEPTQTTDEGLEIPVPKRDSVMDALRKAAKVKTPSEDVADDEPS